MDAEDDEYNLNQGEYDNIVLGKSNNSYMYIYPTEVSHCLVDCVS